MNKILEESFFYELGFYKTSTSPLYKLPLPTLGTYLLATNEGFLWIEYDEGHGDEYIQSVGFGIYRKEAIVSLVGILKNR